MTDTGLPTDAPSGHHRLLGLATLLGAMVLLSGVLFGWVAGAGTIWSTVTGASSAAPTLPNASGGGSGPTGSSASSVSAAAQNVSVTIKNVPTPEGSEPAFVGPNGPGAIDLLTVHVGEKVVMRITNNSDMPHTFSSSALGLNEMIDPNSTMTIRFTAKKVGEISWYCATGCGTFVISHDGFMRGMLKAIA